MAKYLKGSTTHIFRINNDTVDRVKHAFNSSGYPLTLAIRTHSLIETVFLTINPTVKPTSRTVAPNPSHSQFIQSQLGHTPYNKICKLNVSIHDFYANKLSTGEFA